MSTNDKIAALRESYCILEGERFDDVLTSVESPIEKLFLASLLIRLYRPKWVDPAPNPGRQPRWQWFERHDGLVATQAPIGPFIVDFLFLDVPESRLNRCKRRVVVELDGHDFHERTKEQAQRDKARDRALTADGFIVIRFTGSEVFRDAHACIDEVQRILHQPSPAGEVEP